MKTIQMTIDEELLAEVDKTASEIGANRSAFIRAALLNEIRKHRIALLEKKHAEGYARLPLQSDEFDGWEEIQEWGES